MKSVAFYNAKAGVGCTSLVYHLAWMYNDLGYRVVVVDADPQGDLSGLFLGFDVYPWIEYDESRTANSIGSAVVNGIQDGGAFITPIRPTLGLVLGDLELEEWIAEGTRAHGLCFSGARASIPDDLESTRLRRLVVAVGAAHAADLVLIDAGSGLGVCSCLAVTAADAVVLAVHPDDTAETGALAAARAIEIWRSRWQVYIERILDPARVRARREADANFFPGEPLEKLEAEDATWLTPTARLLGHVVTGEAHYAGLKPPQRRRRVSELFANAMRERVGSDSELGTISRWVTLGEMSLQQRKPMFELSPADGAIGSTASAVQRCRQEYAALAQTLATSMGVPSP